MRELALFAGSGGGILGGKLLGWRTVCAVELDAFCRANLLARQRDGFLPKFPIWDDVRTFDGTPWEGHVDIVSGGFPCTDISSAGKRVGIAGRSSGLWKEFARIIGEVRPYFVLVENSPHLRTRGLTTVVRDLTSLGYDCRWGVLGARHLSAPHKRDRMWVVAHAGSARLEVGESKRENPRHEQPPTKRNMASDTVTIPNMRRERAIAVNVEVASTPQNAGIDGQNTPNTFSPPLREQSRGGQRACRPKDTPKPRNTAWRPVDCVEGVDDGLANRVDKIRATGNGQIPSVVELAWNTLTQGWL
jgi:DNA (cytosine-5)-methyltransferase 1